MIVACLQVGNYCKRGREYVEKLHCAVSRHLTLPHTFVCFTDDESKYPTDIEKRALPHPGLKGWFNKLALFKPGVFPDDERVLYFDLDTLIVGPLDAIAAYGGEFAMLGQFFDDVNPIFAGFQSAMMSWRVGETSKPIWSAYEAAGYPETRGGDQKFINDTGITPDVWQEMFPGKLASYKAECMSGIPAGLSVCICHGLPRPHQCGGWVREAWV